MPKNFTRKLTDVLLSLYIRYSRRLSSRRLYVYVKTGKKVIILDVREESEYIDSHIPGAIWFPKSKFDNQDRELLKKLEGINKKTIVVVYCTTGYRGYYVAKELRKMGYNAYNLDGIHYWRKENLPLEKGVRR